MRWDLLLPNLGPRPAPYPAGWWETETDHSTGPGPAGGEVAEVWRRHCDTGHLRHRIDWGASELLVVSELASSLAPNRLYPGKTGHAKYPWQVAEATHCIGSHCQRLRVSLYWYQRLVSKMRVLSGNLRLPYICGSLLGQTRNAISKGDQNCSSCSVPCMAPHAGFLDWIAHSAKWRDVACLMTDVPVGDVQALG